MLSRFAYRLVGVFFFLFTITSWLMAVICLVGLIVEHNPKFLFLGLWSVVLGFLLGGASKDARRAGRRYHYY
jgi:hypothetical protein